MRLFILFLICSFGGQIFAQKPQLIDGTVLDASTKEPIPFVNIIVNDNPSIGTNTDIYGAFKLQISGTIKSLTFSCIGYEKYQWKNNGKGKIIVELVQKQNLLDEVVVFPGVNPAHRIIENATKNRNENSPSQYPYYQCDIYFKYGVPTVFLDSASSVDVAYMGLFESHTRRTYQRPGKISDYVLATKVGGMKNPEFAALATEAQSFNLYQNQVFLFTEQFRNPIAPGSTKDYLFLLKDTLYQYGDTVFVMTFQPRKGKNFSGLKGSIAISTYKWGIKFLRARPAFPGLLDVEMNHEHQLVDGKWFPKQLNFEGEMKISMDTVEAITMKIDAQGKIDRVSFADSLAKQKLPFETIYLDDKAADRDSSYWNKIRSIPLDSLELQGYEFLDSLGEAVKLDAVAKASVSISTDGIWDLGYVAVDLRKFFIFNRFETFRLGGGIYTGSKFSKRIRVGGSYGWGLGDKVEKYSAEVSLLLNRPRQIRIGAAYIKDQFESGKAFQNTLLPPRGDLRAIIIGSMEGYEGYNVTLSGRPLRFAQMALSYSNYRYFDPITGLVEAEKAPISNTLQILQADFRYSYREKIMSSYQKQLVTPSRYPVFYATYVQDAGVKSFDGFLGPTFRKLELRLKDDFALRKLGNFRYTISAGAIEGRVPSYLLIGAFGSKVRDFRVATLNHFQTMQPYEFAADRYVSLFFSHDLGSLVFRSDDFKPKLFLENNIAFGSLRSVHQQDGRQAFSKGYYETGITVNDLLQRELGGIMYIGLGVGTYYRYGPYHLPDLKDNFTYNFTVTGSFR